MAAAPIPGESPPAPPAPAPVTTGQLPPIVPRPRRTLLYVGVAVALALVLVLAYFVVLAPSSSSSSGTGTGVDLTYSQAKPIANQAISGYDGGGWALLFAAGIDSNASVTEPLNSTAFASANCTFTPVSASGSVTIPGTSVNRSSGKAPAWEFAYRNGSGTIALADVISDKGAAVGTLSGACTSYFGLLSAVPSNVVDSSVAAAAAAAQPNASALLRTYPNATAELGLIGGVSFLGLSVGAEWSVTYSTCAFGPGASGVGEAFNATVNASSGAVTDSHLSTGVSCVTTTGTSHTLGSSLSFNILPVSSGPPTWYYNFTAAAVGYGVAWDDFTAQIYQGVIPISTPWTMDAVSAAGAPIATYDPGSGTWSGGSTQAIALGDHLDFTSTSDLTGDPVILTGAGQFTGTIGYAL